MLECTQRDSLKLDESYTFNLIDVCFNLNSELGMQVKEVDLTKIQNAEFHSDIT